MRAMIFAMSGSQLGASTVGRNTAFFDCWPGIREIATRHTMMPHLRCWLAWLNAPRPNSYLGQCPPKSRNTPSAVKRLWFEEGFWRYFCPHTGETRLISAIMREVRFDADGLTDALGLGNRSFHRLVKDSLGISPGVWLRGERAVEMRQLLRAGWSIKKLSAHYGFKHQTDFCVEFKRWHEVPPSCFVADIRRRSYPF